MSHEEVPEGRCGFVLEPGDVNEHVVERYEAGSETWHVNSRAVCCWREVWDEGNDDRCIWHAQSDNKSVEELAANRAEVPERMDGISIPDIELKEAVDFDGCEILAATFDGTNLFGTSFAQVEGRNIHFQNAELQHAQFPGAKLSIVEFSQTHLGGAEFSNVHLKDAQFLESHLPGTHFPNATFRNVRFSDSFLVEAEFSDAHLPDTVFQNSNLAMADFSNANLQHTQFRAETQCEHTIFSDADLRFTQLSGVSLWNAKLSGAQFQHADLSDADASDANFTGALLEQATLTGADMSGADLTNAQLHDAHLLDMRINERSEFGNVIQDEAVADRLTRSNDLSLVMKFRYWCLWWLVGPDDLWYPRSQLDKANTVYRTIQRLYRENSMPRRIDTYYVRARDTRRKQAIIDGDLPRWLYLATQRWVMGYGERPWRVVATSGLVILGCAVAYPLVGGVTETSTGGGTPHYFTVPLPDVLPAWVGLPGVVETVLTSLYFSVVTFTTLGYGDLRPRTGAAQFLATVESLVGAFLLALLVYVLGRRATR